MRSEHLEAWVLSIVDDVIAGRRVEDSRVELKADWLSKVVAEVDGLAPSLRDLVVPTSSGPVVALLFDVSRRPFAVKNTVFGQKGVDLYRWRCLGGEARRFTRPAELNSFESWCHGRHCLPSSCWRHPQKSAFVVP
jgi:hypothetical protein